MKKITMQIYNNLQVLWSSKVKFVSLSQLLGCPLFGSNFGLFRVVGLLSHFWVFKKKRRNKRYKGKERRNKTRKKEREEGVKRKKNNNK